MAREHLSAPRYAVSVLAAAFVWAALGTAASAIPLKIEEPGVSLTLPEGFEEITDPGLPPDSSRLFVRRTAAHESPEAYLTISRLPTNGSPILWEPETGKERTTILGRYVEQLNNQNVAILISQVVSNDTVMIQQSARVPMTPHALLLDLKLHTNDNSEAEALMRQILQSMAQEAQTPAVEPPGWRNAVVYVLLAGILLIIAVGRR